MMKQRCSPSVAPDLETAKGAVKCPETSDKWSVWLASFAGEQRKRNMIQYIQLCTWGLLFQKWQMLTVGYVSWCWFLCLSCLQLDQGKNASCTAHGWPVVSSCWSCGPLPFSFESAPVARNRQVAWPAGTPWDLPEWSGPRKEALRRHKMHTYTNMYCIEYNLMQFLCWKGVSWEICHCICIILLYFLSINCSTSSNISACNLIAARKPSSYLIIS